jgi:hypothetical protein
MGAGEMMPKPPEGFELVQDVPKPPEGFELVTPPSTTEDVLKSGGIGLARGGISLLGMGGDIKELASKGTDWAAGKLGLNPENVATAKDFAQKATAIGPLGWISQGKPSVEITKDIEDVTGEFYKPKTTAGEYAKTVGEFLPAAMLGPGSTGAKLVAGTMAGVGSEAAGQYTKGTSAEPYARLAGGIVGGLGPQAVSRVITPAPASAARQRLVDILNDEGVTSLTAGQRSGSEALRYAESVLGNAPGAGGAANQVTQQGQRQFTRAVMRRAGQGLDDAQPETLLRNNDRLAAEFQALSARNNLTPDNQFINDVGQAVRHYQRVPDSQQRQMVQGYVGDIVQHVRAGQMPGTFYQEMRSRLSRQANGLRQSDPTLSEALRDLRNALDDAMGRSIAPADQQAWQTARREYGAQKTIEKAASRAGEATAEGQIVPANIRNAVATGNNRGAYARGQGEFSELARAGSGVMAPLPQSGTGPRVAINAIAALLGAGGGTIAGGGVGSAVGAAAGAMAGPALAGRALMSRPVQGYLGNQVMARQLERLPPAQQAIVRALMAQERPHLEAQPR